eukprot:g1629.t1
MKSLAAVVVAVLTARSFVSTAPAQSTSGCLPESSKVQCDALQFKGSIWGDVLQPPFELCGVLPSSSAITLSVSGVSPAKTRKVAFNGCPGYDWRAATMGKQALVTRTGYPAVVRALELELPAEPVINELSLDVTSFHGPIGVALNGVLFYGPADAAGRDKLLQHGAKLDPCGGLALESGQYHYVSTPGDAAPLSHYASRNNRFTYCDALPRHMRSVPGLHSPLLGFMLDGIPIYGPMDVGGVPPADLDECQGHTDAEHPFYHYHTTSNFPYTVGCLRGCMSAAIHKRLGTNIPAFGDPATTQYRRVATTSRCGEDPLFTIGPQYEMEKGLSACSDKCTATESCQFFAWKDDFSCATFTHCQPETRISTAAHTSPHSDVYYKIPRYFAECKAAAPARQHDYSTVVAYTAATYAAPSTCLGLSTSLAAAECTAWQQIYDSMGGSSWGVCQRELERSDPCFCSSSSQFVTCEGGHVVKLNLPTNRLVGSIPASISSFSHLRSLNLAGNRIGGTIPAAISSLTALEQLSLSSNVLTGSIPALSALTKLESLNFAANSLGDFCKPTSKLCGNIPAVSALTKLRQFSLGMNLLSGAVPDRARGGPNVKKRKDAGRNKDKHGWTVGTERANSAVSGLKPFRAPAVAMGGRRGTSGGSRQSEGGKRGGGEGQGGSGSGQRQGCTGGGDAQSAGGSWAGSGSGGHCSGCQVGGHGSGGRAPPAHTCPG